MATPATPERIEVRTKAQAEKAIKAGSPIRITAGRFALAVAGMTGVDIEIAKTAEVELTLTDVEALVAQEDMWSSRVEAWGSSRVEARGSSRVEAWGSSRVVARESSRVVARESSRVEAWGSSSVVAWGSSRVEAWGSSRVVAWESSRVVARGYSTLQAHSARALLKASATVCVNLWNGASCDGGRQQVVNLTAVQDWCDFYGVRIEAGQAIVYKGVDKNYRSYHGVAYTPGSMPSDPHWDGKGRECSKGGGLNFSPTPRHTHEFCNPDRYLECRINLSDIVVHWGGGYPQKITARGVAAPLIEVDVDGNRVEAEPIQ